MTIIESLCEAKLGIELFGITRYKWTELTFVDKGCDKWEEILSHVTWEMYCVTDMLWSHEWHQQLMQLTFCCLPNCNPALLSTFELLRVDCPGSRRLHETVFWANGLITHWQITVSEIQPRPFKSQSVSISEGAVLRHKLFYNDPFAMCNLGH